MKKKILLVTTAYNIKGHSYEYTNNFISYLKGEFDIHVFIGGGNENRIIHPGAFFHKSKIDFSKTDALRFSRFPFLREFFRGITKFAYNFHFYNLLHKKKMAYDYDYIFLMDYDYLVLFNYIYKNRDSNNIVVWIHSASFESNSVLYTVYKKLTKIFFKRFSKFVYAFVLTGKTIEKEFVRNIPEAIGKTHVVQYMSQISHKPIDKTVARKILNLPEKKNILLFFGILRKEKNYKEAISSLSKTRTSDPLLILAGAENSVTEKDIDLYCEQNGFNNIIKIIRYLNEEEVNCLYSAADLLMIPYELSNQSQSGPLSLASLYQLPVITRPGGELGHFVLSNGLGIVAAFTDFHNEIDCFFDNHIKYRGINKSIIEYAKANHPSRIFLKYKDVFI